MSLFDIKKNVSDVLKELPSGVELVAAAKSRTPEEIEAAIEAGVKMIGENYVQEAEKAFEAIGNKVKWHFIGHLQKNKVKKAVDIFDMIETVDSATLAGEIDKRSKASGKVMQVLIEINSGREQQKAGVFPEKALELAEVLTGFDNIKVMGLMTMGPDEGDPEDSRPYFRTTKKIFDEIAAKGLENIRMEKLSMGMTNSYKVAIEEGANIVRIGTKIFGSREN